VHEQGQKKFESDGYRFKQDGDKWLWIMLRRRGNSLVTLHKVEFEFGTETAKTISIKPQGKDRGTTPWGKVPAEVVFEVPNGDQIVVTDPQLGKLVYEAKLGLATDERAPRRRPEERVRAKELGHGP